MKTISLFLLFAVIAIGKDCANAANAAEWGATTNGLQMSIGVTDDTEEIRSNLPVKLLIRYRNVTTNERVVFFETRPIENSPSFTFIVISPSGKEVAPTPVPPKNNPYERNTIVLEPSKTIELEFNLSKRCNFNENGTYKVIAKATASKIDRAAKGLLNSFVVISNPLFVPVVREGQSTNSSSNPLQRESVRMKGSIPEGVNP